VLTEAEAAAYEKRLVDAGNVDNRNLAPCRTSTLAYNQVWWDRGTGSSRTGARRSSSIRRTAGFRR